MINQQLGRVQGAIIELEESDMAINVNKRPMQPSVHEWFSLVNKGEKGEPRLESTPNVESKKVLIGNADELARKFEESAREFKRRFG